jgi:hypothetical protein
MRAIRVAALAALIVAVGACGERGANDDAANAAQAAPETEDARPATVTAEQFASMSWLIGEWRGSGGQYPAFYESYRSVNDSTIQMKAWADSTFAVATDSSEIAWRAGAVRSSSDGKVQNVLVGISADSLHFAKVTGQGGDFVWARETADRWTAVIGPARAGGEPTIYRLERVRR